MSLASCNSQVLATHLYRSILRYVTVDGKATITITVHKKPVLVIFWLHNDRDKAVILFTCVSFNSLGLFQWRRHVSFYSKIFLVAVWMYTLCGTSLYCTVTRSLSTGDYSAPSKVHNSLKNILGLCFVRLKCNILSISKQNGVLKGLSSEN